MLKKINVVGTSGSGKSTFAQNLSNTLSIEYIEMDALFWGENWVSPQDEEFWKKLKNSLNKKEWVLDGNYTSTIPLKWKHVDTVIWLDFSFSRTIFQAFRRAVIRISTNKELWVGTGNKESFRRTFLSKDSVLLWTLKTYKRNRTNYKKMMTLKKYSHIKFIRLSSPTACYKFLSNIEKNT